MSGPVRVGQCALATVEVVHPLPVVRGTAGSAHRADPTPSAVDCKPLCTTRRWSHRLARALNVQTTYILHPRSQ